MLGKRRTFGKSRYVWMRMLNCANAAPACTKSARNTTMSPGPRTSRWYSKDWPAFLKQRMARGHTSKYVFSASAITHASGMPSSSGAFASAARV